MSAIELYDWRDCTAYLNHMIVRVNDHYTIIGIDPGSKITVEFETIDRAKRAVECFYLSDLVYSVLVSAVSNGHIDQNQCEELIMLMDDQFDLKLSTQEKLVQKCSTFPASDVS